MTAVLSTAGESYRHQDTVGRVISRKVPDWNIMAYVVGLFLFHCRLCVI